MFARIVFDQTATTWLRLNVEAFEYFGGVPEVAHYGKHSGDHFSLDVLEKKLTQRAA